MKTKLTKLAQALPEIAEYFYKNRKRLYDLLSEDPVFLGLPKKFHSLVGVEEIIDGVAYYEHDMSFCKNKTEFIEIFNSEVLENNTLVKLK